MATPNRYEARAIEAVDYKLIDARLSEDETLAGPKLLRVVWIVMGVTLFLIFGWTAFAPLNRGVTASGAISTVSARQVIQNLDGGIVQSIAVKEGETVKAGQVLMNLDDTLARTQYQIVRQQYFDHLGERAMLEAAIQGGPIIWPKEMLDLGHDPMIETVMTSQQKVLSEKRASRNAQKDVLMSQVTSLGDQANGLRAQVDSVQAQSKLIKEEADGVETLYHQGYAPKTRLLALQRNAANLAGDLGQTRSQISQANTMMAEKRLQALQTDAQGRQEDSARLSIVVNETLQLSEKMADQFQVLARTTIRSPVDGVVLARHIGTVGGVVKPGEPVLDIVPTDDILVTSRLRPQDVENVHVGMKAKIKFTGLNVQTTPQLDGHVTYLSADSLADEKTGQRFYEMRISIPRSERSKLKDVTLSPGMPAEVMADGGARTMLQYLLQPISAAFSTAFRD